MKIVTVFILEVLNPLFAISFALFVSVGYILSLLMPVSIGHWQALLIPSTLIPFGWLLAGAIKRSKHSASNAHSFSLRDFSPLVVPALALAPGLYAIASSPTVQVLSNPDLHYGYINQALHGSTPFENIFVAGFPANYYWLFHAYVAAFTQWTTWPASYIGTIVNVLAVCSSFLWIGQALVILGLAKPRTFTLGLLTTFVFCSLNATGILSLLAHHLTGTYPADDLRILLLDGAHKHLHSTLNKLANINSTDLGISLFAAALYCCLKILKGEIRFRHLVLISACGILGLATAQFATVYIVVTLLGGLLVTGAAHLLGAQEKRGHIGTFWHKVTGEISETTILIFLAASLILSVPLLQYNFDMSYNTRHLGGFALFNQSNMGMLWGAFALLLPLYLLQWLFVLRRRERLAGFIQISAALGLLLGSGLTVTQATQHKGIYSLALLMGISALLALRSLFASERRPWRSAGRAIALCLFALVFLRVAYVNYALLNRSQTLKYSGFAYDGSHIIHTVDKAGRFPAYYWIRDNSPADALVITPLDSFIFASVLPERQFYVKKAQYTYTTGINDYDRRVRQLDKFYRDETGPAEYHYMSRNIASNFPDRPIYAVVKDSEVSPEVMAGRDAELVFEHEGDGANVYRLYPSADPPQES